MGAINTQPPARTTATRIRDPAPASPPCCGPPLRDLVEADGVANWRASVILTGHVECAVPRRRAAAPRILSRAGFGLGEVRGDLTGGQPAGGQRQHDLVDPAQPLLPLAHNGRIEAALPIPRHLDLHRADLRQHRLRPMPLRELPPLRPAGSCLSYPTCSVISASRAVSSTVLVNPASIPPGPTRSTPSARAFATRSRASCCDQSEPAWARSSRSLQVLPAAKPSRPACRTSYTVLLTDPCGRKTPGPAARGLDWCAGDTGRRSWKRQCRSPW